MKGSSPTSKQRGKNMELDNSNILTQQTPISIEDELSFKIIGACIEVHKTLGGPGLLESVYEAALCHELTLRGLCFERQKPVQVIYKGVAIKDPLYVDIIVEGKVLIAIKAVEKLNSIFETQVLTYLRLTGIKLGLLVNFGAPSVRNGITRIINGQP